MGVVGRLNVLGRSQDELQECVVRLQQAVKEIGGHAHDRHKDYQQHPHQPGSDLHRLLADARHAIAHQHQPYEGHRPPQNRVIIHGVNGDESD